MRNFPEDIHDQQSNNSSPIAYGNTAYDEIDQPKKVLRVRKKSLSCSKQIDLSKISRNENEEESSEIKLDSELQIYSKTQKYDEEKEGSPIINTSIKTNYLITGVSKPPKSNKKLIVVRSKTTTKYEPEEIYSPTQPNSSSPDPQKVLLQNKIQAVNIRSEDIHAGFQEPNIDLCGSNNSSPVHKLKSRSKSPFSLKKMNEECSDLPSRFLFCPESEHSQKCFGKFLAELKNDFDKILKTRIPKEALNKVILSKIDKSSVGITQTRSCWSWIWMRLWSTRSCQAKTRQK